MWLSGLWGEWTKNESTWKWKTFLENDNSNIQSVYEAQMRGNEVSDWNILNDVMSDLLKSVGHNKEEAVGLVMKDDRFVKMIDYKYISSWLLATKIKTEQRWL